MRPGSTKITKANVVRQKIDNKQRTLSWIYGWPVGRKTASSGPEKSTELLRRQNEGVQIGRSALHRVRGKEERKGSPQENTLQ
ncbi:hypothetical protein NDU88_001830, partial [Pleurodeles waltl]